MSQAQGNPFPAGTDTEYGTVIKSSFVGQSIQNGQGWKKRLAVLTDTQLCLYQIQDFTKPNCIISLKNISTRIATEQNRKNAFAIKTPTEEHILAAINEKEMNEWVQFFSQKQKSETKQPPQINHQTNNSIIKSVESVQLFLEHLTPYFSSNQDSTLEQYVKQKNVPTEIIEYFEKEKSSIDKILNEQSTNCIFAYLLYDFLKYKLQMKKDDIVKNIQHRRSASNPLILPSKEVVKPISKEPKRFSDSPTPIPQQSIQTTPKPQQSIQTSTDTTTEQTKKPIQGIAIIPSGLLGELGKRRERKTIIDFNKKPTYEVKQVDFRSALKRSNTVISPQSPKMNFTIKKEEPKKIVESSIEKTTKEQTKKPTISIEKPKTEETSNKPQIPTEKPKKEETNKPTIQIEKEETNDKPQISIEEPPTKEETNDKPTISIEKPPTEETSNEKIIDLDEVTKNRKKLDVVVKTTSNRKSGNFDQKLHPGLKRGKAKRRPTRNLGAALKNLQQVEELAAKESLSEIKTVEPTPESTQSDKQDSTTASQQLSENKPKQFNPLAVGGFGLGQLRISPEMLKRKRTSSEVPKKSTSSTTAEVKKTPPPFVPKRAESPKPTEQAKTLPAGGFRLPHVGSSSSLKKPSDTKKELEKTNSQKDFRSILKSRDKTESPKPTTSSPVIQRDWRSVLKKTTPPN